MISTRKTFTLDERAAIARNFAGSGESQDVYARRFGITGRTLRNWLDLYTRRSHPPDYRMRRFLEQFIAEAQQFLGSLDADRDPPAVGTELGEEEQTTELRADEPVAEIRSELPDRKGAVTAVGTHSVSPTVALDDEEHDVQVEIPAGSPPSLMPESSGSRKHLETPVAPAVVSRRRFIWDDEDEAAM